MFSLFNYTCLPFWEKYVKYYNIIRLMCVNKYYELLSGNKLLFYVISSITFSLIHLKLFINQEHNNLVENQSYFIFHVTASGSIFQIPLYRRSLSSFNNTISQYNIALSQYSPSQCWLPFNTISKHSIFYSSQYS